MKNSNQRGIAIGPILFIMAILAVLAAAIAAGSGSFSGDTSAISAKAQASAILEYANEVKFAVDRVLAKGCTDTEISFENPIVSGYENPNAPSDKPCHVFDVNGGGIVWKNPPSGIDLSSVPLNYQSYVFTGYMNLMGGAVTNNAANGDIAILLPGLSDGICNAIINLGGKNSTYGSVVLNKFVGIYSSWGTGEHGQFGCINLSMPNAGTPGLPLGLHYFFYVLHNRTVLGG